MKVYNWNEFLDAAPLKSVNTALSVGVFDGVHIGHRTLINKITRCNNALPLIITFTDNPLRTLKPELYRGKIVTLTQKLARLEELGIEAVILIDFSADFSKLEGDQFFRLILQNCSLKYLAVGSDFHCGRNADTNAEKAREILSNHGAEVEILEQLVIDGYPVSSTMIRQAVINGDMGRVKRLLGIEHIIDLSGIQGKVLNGETVLKRKDILQILPDEGIYTCRIGNMNEKFDSRIKIFQDEISWHHKTEIDAGFIKFLD